MEAIGSDLSRLDGRPRPDALVGMGGAVTNITAVKHGMTEYDPNVVQGAVLDADELDRQITLYRERDADARRQIPGLQPKRAEVILAGALVIRTVMRKLDQSSLTVSDRGLRHGVLAERFGDSGDTELRRSSWRRRRNETPRWSDEEMRTLMSLIRGSDSVELKLTVPTEDQRATITGLPMDPVEAQPRQVFFFDTPDLALDKAGAGRACAPHPGRRAAIRSSSCGRSCPQSCRRRSASPWHSRREVDAMPGGFVASGSMKGRSTGAAISDVVRGTKPMRKIFSKEQRAFYAAHAPAGIELDSLVPLGPTFLLKLHVHAKGAAAPVRRGDVALPGRLADPGAVDEGPADGGVPGRRRDARISRVARAWT